MNRYDAASTVVAGVAVGLLVFVGLRVYRDRHPQESAPQIRRVSPDLVIGPRRDFRRPAAAPNTLVEFGDYQCGPCAVADFTVTGILTKYWGKLQLCFRNFPLPMHHDAYRAAVAAESARALGRFWPMHDALFQANGRLTGADIARIVDKLHLDRARFARASGAARTAVDEDIRDGRALGVNGTPAFFLCTATPPRVWMLQLDQLERVIPPPPFRGGPSYGGGGFGPPATGPHSVRGRHGVRPPRQAAPPRPLPGIPRHEAR